MLNTKENIEAANRIIEVGYQQWYKETHPDYIDEKIIIESIDDAMKEMEEWRKITLTNKS